MRKTLRLAVVASALGAALALAGTALATPKLIIAGATNPGSARVSIQFLEDKSDAAPARIAIYAPAGYTSVVTASPGTVVGTVHADLQALAISPDAVISADGQIIAANPADPAVIANTCAPGQHTAVWLLRVTVTGQTLNVPVYVDAPAPTADPLAGASPVKLTVCFSSPYVPTDAGGAPFGAKVLNAILQMNQGTLTTPVTRGSYMWRTVVTPYTVGTASPNVPGTVEARALVDTPQVLGISVKVTNKRKHMVRITGTLRAGQFAIGGATVRLSRGPARNKTKPTTKAKTNAKGIVTFNLHFKKGGRMWFGLSTTVPAYDATSQGCKTPTAPTLPCASATASGFAAATRFVGVRV
jgi:hypothetical protein